MELKEALDIVSYKIGLRFGETVLGDELFLDKKIHAWTSVQLANYDTYCSINNELTAAQTQQRVRFLVARRVRVDLDLGDGVAHADLPSIIF